MNPAIERRQFVAAQSKAAERALAGLNDNEKVNFAYALLMKTTDPCAVGSLSFAGKQIIDLSNVLMREAHERGC